MPRGDSFDERLLHWIAEHRVDSLTSFTRHLMHLGDVMWLVWTVAAVAVLGVVYLRAWRAGAALGVAFFAGGFVAGLLKGVIERNRPAFPDALVQIGGYAMPSSHAAFTMAMAVALLVVVSWTSRRILVLAAAGLGLVLLTVGLSMIYLGAHWATDVLAGWTLGAVIGGAVGLVFKPRTRSRGAGMES